MGKTLLYLYIDKYSSILISRRSPYCFSFLLPTHKRTAFHQTGKVRGNHYSAVSYSLSVTLKKQQNPSNGSKKKAFPDNYTEKKQL